MKPIGYWLNRTDRALTRSMDATLEEFGLTRIAWQVLNTLRETPGSADADVLEALSANADAHALTTAVDTVLADGWAMRPAPGRLALSDGGGERLAAVAQRVDAFRAMAMTGITPDEFRAAVLVLERMTHNVETAMSAASRS
ncbi:MarR family winged helix-turn-helix transcriptional regulator [Streptomyces gibsoniae]|uniref:MarR family winged helix-turn-helix transcriptional regulator n=1 Tax=Streptomyces gibsoniae TaxID=3075529 RepID=A0ABU2U4D1_9ACTN|nr:MarR family winged helix-turn-helix transcriptional regulator [Streptomyces sp. DSM 41699]MDT0468013.1 MarR family winged helix-turn-helix transcriptional regulator [Streptomyces sp. DSM 41699]